MTWSFEDRLVLTQRREDAKAQRPKMNSIGLFPFPDTYVQHPPVVQSLAPLHLCAFALKRPASKSYSSPGKLIEVAP